MELKNVVLYQSILAAFHFAGMKALYTANRWCNSTGFCLVVYGTSNREGITWHQSREACIGENAALASIQDSVVQSQVEAVLGTIPVLNGDPYTHGVWIGGRRSEIGTWRMIDGTSLSGPQLRTDQEIRQFCGSMNVDENIYADNCDETRGNISALCQYIQPDNTCTIGSYTGFLFLDMCYYVYTHKPGRGDWYDAQTFCNTQLGGDLAYTHINNITFRRGVITRYNRQVWIGIVRYPWSWENGSPVSHFAWDPGMWTSDAASHERRDRMMISLDTSNRFKWISATSTQRLHYLLCQYQDDSYPGEAGTTTRISEQTIANTSITTTITSSIETTTTQSTPVRTKNGATQTETTSTRMQADDSWSTTTAEITHKPRQNTTRDKNSGMHTDEGSFPMVAVAASVAAAVVIVMVIIIVVIVFRKRKAGKSATETPSSNPFDDPVLCTSDPPEDTPESGYSSVVDNPQYQSKDDLVEPNDKFFPGPFRATEHKNRVSRLFQGAFWKAEAQADQPNTDHTTQDDVKAFYTVPNTSKKNFAGPSKKPKIKTAKPKLKVAGKAARPDVAHVEAPTGQIYALSMKNVL